MSIKKKNIDNDKNTIDIENDKNTIDIENIKPIEKNIINIDNDKNTIDIENFTDESFINNKLIKKISDVLLLICENNTDNNYAGPFSKDTMPVINIYDFIKRIIKYFECSDSFLIISLIYIDRYCAYSKKNIYKQSIHRLIFISCVLAVKYNEDDNFSNKFYSTIAGISVKELNSLEHEMLITINYNLNIEPVLYNEYLKNFIKK
jgi:hypothetical protein